MSTYDSTQDTKAHIARVDELLNMAADELRRRGSVHDQSKLADPEKALFDEYTPKLKDCTYGSDEYKAFLAGLKPALDHHYAHNSHHPEHYPWHCPACNWQGNSDSFNEAPRIAPGVTAYCPRCSAFSIIYETELMHKPSLGVRGMDLFDLVEMFFDWKAATERMASGDIHKSIEINTKRFELSPQLASILSNTAKRLGY